MKLLLNAESFGFGPSASISVIFDILKNLGNEYQLDYIGSGHTLDLQSKLSYNKIYVYENEEQFKNIVKDYDYFITALDFEKSKFAKDVNIKTIVYDTLLWYWKDLEMISSADYYITQDFYSVKEIRNKLKNKNIYIIPPLIQKKEKIKNDKELLLINFGGLENPYWSIDITVSYIRSMLNIILPIVKNKYKTIEIVCSKNHIEYLEDFNVKTVSYKEMQNILKQAKYIIATSGLGNIYEIANYEIPSLFLPPVNDSQGQQLEILKEFGVIDNQIDWEEINNKINYFKSQSEVLNKIELNIKNIDLGKLDIEFKLKNEMNGNMNLKDLFKNFSYNGKNLLKEVLKEILGEK